MGDANSDLNHLKTDYPRKLLSSQKVKKWKLVKPVLMISKPLAIVSVLFGMIVMLGYATNNEFLYRPIFGGPATNPLTALSIIFVGLSLCFTKAVLGRFKRLLALSAFILTSLRLFDALAGTELSVVLTPFSSIVDMDHAAGKSNVMGFNSALMLCCLSIALMLSHISKPALVQNLIFIALAFPSISITGYAYGVVHFYGQMSLITTILGFALTLSALAMTANRAVLRTVLSPYIGGYIARRQILLGISIPFFLGLLIIKLPTLGTHDSAFSLFVIIISWFIISMIGFSAVTQEDVDSRRRSAERALSMAALSDELTKLPNRRMFYETGKRELARSHRLQNELWILMIDIDFFKRVNDTAGHLVGDHVLAKVSEVLPQLVRFSDMVGRLGGEEFAVLLTDTTQSGAELVAETIRSSIRALEIPDWTAKHGPITVSIGCAGSSFHVSFEGLLASADAALYQAKEQGRNRTVMAANLV